MEPTWSGRLRRVRNVLGRVALALGVIVLLRVVWHLFQRDDARALIDGRTESELVTRRDYLASHIDEASHAVAPKDTQLAGEWTIVTLSMTAIAAANIGFEHSATVPADLELVTRCAELARKKETRAFDASRWGDDPIDAMDGPNAHIGYLGHLALVLESYRLLGGRDPDLAALEPKVIAALTSKLRTADAALAPTYPNETYVADNAVVIAALALADVGHEVRITGNEPTSKGPHAALVAQTLSTWRARYVDKTTGALVFGPNAGARGSGAALSAMMLTYVDEVFATEQAKALATHFGDHALGMFTVVCEHPGCGGGGDVDSGPLVLGASPSATGFAIALAKRTGDATWLDGLLATGEWAGLGFSWSGKRRYLLAPLVGDAVVLAAKSARAWDVRYL